MGRITQEEREANKKRFDAIVFDIFLTEGWDACTLNRISKECGIRKSTLQGYYPSKENFAEALEGKIFPLVGPRLNFTSRDGFVKGWVELLTNDRLFKEVVKMLIGNIVTNGGNLRTQAPIIRIINLLSKNIGEEEAHKSIQDVFGLTIYKYTFGDK